MRKVSQSTIACFLAGIATCQSNTAVDIESGVVKLKLHGNTIAERRDGKLYITNAGWKSNVTKEILNALPGVSVAQRQGEWYLNGVLWDGKLIEVK